MNIKLFKLKNTHINKSPKNNINICRNKKLKLLLVI